MQTEPLAHRDIKSRCGLASDSNLCWEALVFHRWCIYFMVSSEGEWTVVLLCQGVWQWGSGTSPQLPDGSLTLRKVSNNVSRTREKSNRGDRMCCSKGQNTFFSFSASTKRRFKSKQRGKEIFYSNAKPLRNKAIIKKTAKPVLHFDLQNFLPGVWGSRPCFHCHCVAVCCSSCSQKGSLFLRTLCGFFLRVFSDTKCGSCCHWSPLTLGLLGWEPLSVATNCSSLLLFCDLWCAIVVIEVNYLSRLPQLGPGPASTSVAGQQALLCWHEHTLKSVHFPVHMIVKLLSIVCVCVFFYIVYYAGRQCSIVV